MSIDRHLGMPNTLLQVIQACTLHPAKVKYVNDPTGSGRVQAECQSVFGDAKSNWLQIGGNHVGNDDSSKHQKLIMVSSEPYCKVYLGEYDGEIKEGGDCSEIDTSAMESMILEPNHVYMGDAMTLLHETLPATHTSNRALIRINAYATD